MSMETSQWLNQNTLIGFTEKRGTAWHYRAEDQGDEPNHYEREIPVEDVRRRLFHWEAIEGDVVSNAVTPEGVLTVRDPDRKTIIRPDTGDILGVFKKGYQIHQYDEWLLECVEAILDDDLAVGSAGLLKKGAVAWVSVEVPDTIVTPEGVRFRPNLLAATSLDGSLATTYKRCVTNVVCDNTMAAGLSEEGERFKVKHSRYSKVKLMEAREALSIIHSVGDDFERQVAALTADRVSDNEFVRFLKAYAPAPDEDGRSRTIALNKQAALTKLWNDDARVSPWKNTAWGVLQAVNTASHHVFGADKGRAERNMLRAVTNGVDKLDADTLDMLAGVRG